MWNQVDTGGATERERTLDIDNGKGLRMQYGRAQHGPQFIQFNECGGRFTRQDRKPTGPFSASAANSKGDHTGSSNLDGKESISESFHPEDPKGFVRNAR